MNEHRPPDPQTYVPKSLTRIQAERMRTEAAKAHQQLVKTAKSDGVNIVAVSGCRSCSTQAGLYDSYGQAVRAGEIADTVATQPGHSEHRIGLDMDVGNASGVCAPQDCVEGIPVGKWVADHADEHGFIIRYPPGEERVTGYTYEPWHIRCVGSDVLAKQMHPGAKAPGVPDVDTMEEFFGLEPAPDCLPSAGRPRPLPGSAVPVGGRPGPGRARRVRFRTADDR